MKTLYEKNNKKVLFNGESYCISYTSGEIQVVMIEQDLTGRFRTLLFDNFSDNTLYLKGPRKKKSNHFSLMQYIYRNCEGLYKSSESPLLNDEHSVRIFLKSYFGKEKTNEIIDKVEEFITL